MSSNIPRIGLTDEVSEDLAKSGLNTDDLAARALGPAEMASSGISSIQGQPPLGYVIPYFDIKGNTVKFYRTRLLVIQEGDPKYRQPKGTVNHMYFPLGFQTALKGSKYVIITEGEKKAACAVKLGFPTCAVPGVDSWKNRSLVLPKDTKLTQGKNTGQISAKLPSGTDNAVTVQDTGPLAVGLDDLIDTVIAKGLTVIIIYDSDKGGGVKFEVQRACAMFGYELRYRGVPIKRIRQLVLPAKRKKVGLDDFLMTQSTEELRRLIKVCLNKRTAFPRHPNPTAFISARLQKARLNRKETQDISISIIAELEARGRRLRTVGANELHYFDESEHTLYQVNLNTLRAPLHEEAFGPYLYREFGIGEGDKRVLEWLATQFTGEPTVYPTETHKVLTVMQEPGYKDCVAYQLSDSHYCVVTHDPDNPLILKENGTHGILFEQGQVEALDIKELEVQFYHTLDIGPQNLWLEVLETMAFKPPINVEDTKSPTTTQEVRKLVSLLYYISPWLRRWRNTQLPIELIIGEAGSGKSSLLSLRQTIVMGAPHLSNMTTDIRDWWASVTSRGGIHVLDNVHFTTQTAKIRQQLSDEICRLITEPNPHVEMRKLYTSSQVLSLPVVCTFATTAIEQPFYSADLIQRAAIFELDAIVHSHDSEWTSKNLKLGGGRIGWVANHLAAIHRFLVLAITKRDWNHDYPAGHRLANYEQCLLLMAKVLGMDSKWIPGALAYTVEGQMSEADWVHRALKAFVKFQKEENPVDYFQMEWSVNDMSEWFQEHDVFSKNSKVTNSWKLGRYIQSHKQNLENSIKLYENGKRANRYIYGILRHKDEDDG